MEDGCRVHDFVDLILVVNGLTGSKNMDWYFLKKMHTNLGSSTGSQCSGMFFGTLLPYC